MKEILGDESEAFFKAIDSHPVVSVRLNSRKPSEAFDGCATVPWCPTGRYLDFRPVFTLDPLLHAGAYYVQDASSMILYDITKRIMATLAEQSGKSVDTPLSVIDLCAAPGGKTTAIIDALPDESIVIANEFVPKRAAVLRENIAKWGYRDVSVMNCDTRKFVEFGSLFDIVNVDAPCSGEGMMRKDPDAVVQWSPQLIGQCASLQREILSNAAQIVKPGGFLIYSTCTFNHIENEENAEFIRDKLGLVPFNPSFPADWNIGKGIGTDLPVSRFMPHLTRGEGLFLAIFRKPGEYIPSQIIPWRQSTHKSPGELAKSPVKSAKSSSSTKMKKEILHNTKGKKDILPQPPTMEDILSGNFDTDRFPCVDVDVETALQYLRRESVVLPPGCPKGIVIVTYRNLPLGPAKNIGTRANNLYPKNWRILMR